jgi:hypothetical protein
MNQVAVVEAQLRAYNARDIDAFVACYSPDIVIEDAVGTLVMRGRDQLTAEYASFFEGHPDLHVDVVARLTIGEHVIDEERLLGVQADPVRAVVAYRVRSDSIDHVRIYRAMTLPEEEAP